MVNNGNYTTKHNPTSINSNNTLLRQAQTPTHHAGGPSGQQIRHHKPHNSYNGAPSNRDSTFSGTLKYNSERVISDLRNYE